MQNSVWDMQNSVWDMQKVPTLISIFIDDMTSIVVPLNLSCQLFIFYDLSKIPVELTRWVIVSNPESIIPEVKLERTCYIKYVSFLFEVSLILKLHTRRVKLNLIY